MASTSHCPPKRGSPTIVHLAWARYKQQLQRNPLRTKALTSACIAGVSDVIAQNISGRKYDFGRTLKLMLYGLVWNGPAAHYWQNFLQMLFKGKSDSTMAIKKVIVDQLTFGPVCNILFMSYMNVVVNGVSPYMAFTVVARDYPGVQLKGWKVWPVASLVNYRFIPLQFRVLFMNLVALFWGIFLITQARVAATR